MRQKIVRNKINVLTAVDSSLLTKRDTTRQKGFAFQSGVTVVGMNYVLATNELTLDTPTFYHHVV